jgi:hypothetical protein
MQYNVQKDVITVICAMQVPDMVLIMRIWPLGLGACTTNVLLKYQENMSHCVSSASWLPG